MRRFFFSVDEAVKLVLTAMEHIEIIQGKVLSRRMKAAQIQDLLNRVDQHKGGRWERMEGRPGSVWMNFLSEISSCRTLRKFNMTELNITSFRSTKELNTH